jgi:LysR family transcriptional regulator, glycine cleavage system transcriptional activator
MALQRLPPLNAVRAFEAAARNLSFKTAGAELNVTPGAISRQIELLEQHLGMRLFERLHRQVELTVSGRVFLNEVGPALLRIANASAMVSLEDEHVLRIKLPPTFAIRWFVPRLARFHALDPTISVQVTTSHDPVDFDREQVDAAVYWGEHIARGLLGVRLLGETLVPVCSPTLLNSGGGRTIDSHELSRHVLLHSFRRPDDWRRWFVSAGLPDMELHRLLVFENSSLTYQGAIDGLGVALAQLSFVQDDLKTGRLVIANPLRVETEAAYFLTYPRERAHLRRIRSLQEWITMA